MRPLNLTLFLPALLPRVRVPARLSRVQRLFLRFLRVGLTQTRFLPRLTRRPFRRRSIRRLTVAASLSVYLIVVPRLTLRFLRALIAVGLPVTAKTFPIEAFETTGAPRSTTARSGVRSSAPRS